MLRQAVTAKHDSRREGVQANPPRSQRPCNECTPPQGQEGWKGVAQAPGAPRGRYPLVSSLVYHPWTWHAWRSTILTTCILHARNARWNRLVEI